MKIIVGSKNPNKVEAVREVFTELSPNDLEVAGIEVDSNINDQPITMEETIQGAINRAKNAYQDCDFSVGIEGGLMEVPHSKSGYMQFEACVLFDGSDCYLGLTGLFAIPTHIIETIKKEGINLSHAFLKHGHTDSEYIGHDQGVIGIFTKGKINRKEFTKQAVEMMLIHFNNKEIFEM
mgnify:FL=1